MSKKKIAVVGAGISGLSTAWMLNKSVYDITVIAAAFSPDITSNKAAAFWFPYHIRNDNRGIRWCRESYTAYQQFSKNNETGVSMQVLKKALRKGVEDSEANWVEFLPEGICRILTGVEISPQYETVYEVTVPLIETQIFLPWLMEKLKEDGVQFKQEKITSLLTISRLYDFVFNCSALGSRLLCDDKTIIPVRGQVGLLAPDASPSIFYLDNETPLYIVPRQDAIIVGGTYEENISADVTEPDMIQRLLHNAYQVFPHLKQQRVLGSWAGLRPVRPTLRVEREDNSNIIHNYGHGGSGFTLAFGTAGEAVSLI